MKHLYLFGILLILLFNQTRAQKLREDTIPKKNSSKNKYRTEISPYSLTFRGGLTQFFGELGQQDMKGSLGLGLVRSINKNLSLNLEYTAGKLGGQQEQLFNSYFVNEYNLIEILAKWNLLEQFQKEKPIDYNLSIYGGLGLMFFTANAYDMTTDELVRFSNSKASKRNQLFLRWGNPGGKSGIKKTRERVIPIGTSLEFILSEKLKVGVDYRFYFIRTDKADATSGQRLLNPEEADSYSDTPNDKFSLLSVSLTHSFAKPGRR